MSSVTTAAGAAPRILGSAAGAEARIATDTVMGLRVTAALPFAPLIPPTEEDSPGLASQRRRKS